jgi:hypothetical protein
MSISTKTDYTKARFTLKEFGDGTPWIMCEPYEPGLPVLEKGDSYFGLQFRPHITFEQAEEFVKMMHDCIEGIRHTQFLE